VDPSVALSLPGVRTYINADDVPGSNLTGYYVRDEEIFATDKVGDALLHCRELMKAMTATATATL